jgi:hypothetical protein
MLYWRAHLSITSTYKVDTCKHIASTHCLGHSGRDKEWVTNPHVLDLCHCCGSGWTRKRLQEVHRRIWKLAIDGTRGWLTDWKFLSHFWRHARVLTNRPKSECSLPSILSIPLCWQCCLHNVLTSFVDRTANYFQPHFNFATDWMIQWRFKHPVSTRKEYRRFGAYCQKVKVIFSLMA